MRRPGTPAGAGGHWLTVLVDLPPLPMVTDLPWEKVAPQVQVRPYAGSPSLAAWKASRRSVLSVRLAVGESQAFPVDEEREYASLPETCVPWDYRWPEVPLRWMGLVVGERRAVFDEFTAAFDPRRCAVSPTKRRRVELVPLLSIGRVPMLFGYQTAASVFFFVPPGATLAADASSRHRLGAATRVELPATGGTLLASYGALLMPEGAAPFVLRIDVLPGSPPQIVARVEPA